MFLWRNGVFMGWFGGEDCKAAEKSGEFLFRPGMARARPSEDGRYVTATRSGGLLLGLVWRRVQRGTGRRLGSLLQRMLLRLRLATMGRKRSLRRGGPACGGLLGGP